MKVLLRTYTKSGSYFLPHMPEEMGNLTYSVSLDENHDHYVSHLITLNSEADVIRYLILVSREWNELIQENISHNTLVNNIDALANLYEQIIQIPYLLLPAKVITEEDYHYFAKSINVYLEGPDHPLFKDLKPIFKVHDGYTFNFEHIKHTDNPNLLTILTLY